MKSISSYFREKAELRSAMAAAKANARQIKVAIEQGKATDISNILMMTPGRALKLIPTVNKSFMDEAFDKGQVDVVDALITGLYDSNPNQFFETSVSEYIGNNDKAWRTTHKTYLYSAIERKNADLALYLAQHPKLDLDQLSYQTFRGETPWQCLAIAQARETGLLQVVIALAERLAKKRRDQGRKYMDEMNVEAQGFEHEAEQLRRLDLPSGVYKLPALNKTETFKL